MADADWTDAENDLIVADYFAMLGADLAGRAYVKAEHRRRLQPLLNKRSEGSVELKHQNITAVLLGLGQPWIEGYKPASRFQGTLVGAVLRWLEARPDWLLPGWWCQMERLMMAWPKGYFSSTLTLARKATTSFRPPLVSLSRYSSGVITGLLCRARSSAAARTTVERSRLSRCMMNSSGVSACMS